MYTRKIGAAAIVILTLLSLSCHDLIGPIDELPGSRNYVWTIDTLSVHINDIWGSSPNNIWAVGTSPEFNGLLHYDGKEWKEYVQQESAGALYGFSENNVWMVGGSDIWHFDGNDWRLIFEYIGEGALTNIIHDIWGPSEENIYACGTNIYADKEPIYTRGFVLHYNGTSWKEIINADFDSRFWNIRNEEQKVFVFSDKIDDGNWSFYELQNNKQQEFYFNPEDRIYPGSLQVIKQKTYFLSGNTIFGYHDNVFIKLFSVVNPNFGYQYYGRNGNDIFLRMLDGLAHYNGTDIQYLYKGTPNLVDMSKSVVFEKEVFFWVWDKVNTNMILHGKLEE